MSTFIQVSNLKFSFPNTNKQLLNIVDLNINQGEKIFLHGPSGFAFCGCTVVPAFNFDNFELAKRTALTEKFPQHSELINKLTRQ